MKKITLKDMANELGISKGTVDRAIHDRPDVSAETKRRVLDLIKKYGYKPDRIARSLSLKSKRTRIGVIYQSEPRFFWDSVKKGIKAAEAELSDFGLEVMERVLVNGRHENEIIQKMKELIEEKVDAIALVPVNNRSVSDMINAADDGGIAVATFNDDIRGSRRIFYVGPQMNKSGRIAGELMGKFLRAKGRVLTINGNIESLEYQERLEGFNEVLKTEYSDIKVIANYTFDDGSMESGGDRVIRSLLENSGDIDGIYDIDGATLYKIGNMIKFVPKLKGLVLIGHEISDEVKEMLADGVIAACISQNPYSQGYYTIKLLFDYLTDNGKPGFDRMYTRLDVIFKENIINQDNVIGPFYL